MLTPDEPARLAALHNLAILDTLPEQCFDDITLLAAYICDTPIALVSLVDTARQWFKSRYGLDATETPRDIAFCTHAILQTEELFVVPDAAQDVRFARNPLVTGDLSVRFHAGALLVMPDGHALGTPCVIDREPRGMHNRSRCWKNDFGTRSNLRHGTKRAITVSVGVTCSRGQVMADRLIDVADQALYRAKAAGLDRAVFFDIQTDVISHAARGMVWFWIKVEQASLRQTARPVCRYRSGEALSLRRRGLRICFEGQRKQLYDDQRESVPRYLLACRITRAGC